MNLKFMSGRLCFALLLVAFCASCSSDEDGGGEAGREPVVFSDSLLLFDGAEDTVCVQADVTGWWIDCVLLTDGETDDVDTFVVSAEDVLTQKTVGALEREYGWLTIRRDGTDVAFVADVNMYDRRTFRVSVRNGDFVTWIEGEQDTFMGSFPGDRIRMTPTQMDFGWEGGTIKATSATEWWWVESILCGNKRVTITAAERAEFEEHHFKKTLGWIVVEKQGRDLYVTLTPNRTGLERHFEVSVQWGDFFNLVTGVQPSINQ